MTELSLEKLAEKITYHKRGAIASVILMSASFIGLVTGPIYLKSPEEPKSYETLTELKEDVNYLTLRKKELENEYDFQAVGLEQLITKKTNEVERIEELPEIDTYKKALNETIDAQRPYLIGILAGFVGGLLGLMYFIPDWTNYSKIRLYQALEEENPKPEHIKAAEKTASAQ